MCCSYVDYLLALAKLCERSFRGLITGALFVFRVQGVVMEDELWEGRRVHSLWLTERVDMEEDMLSLWL